MVWVDRWPLRAPRAEELPDWELQDFLRVAHRNPNAFSDWECDFCDSLDSQMDTKMDILSKECALTQRQQEVVDNTPSSRQIDVLNRGLLRRLWNNDPELWK